MKNVWVTRTLPGGLAAGEKLREAGCKVVIAPLLEISEPEIFPPALPRDAILAMTSKNGIAALTRQTDERYWPVVTVGDATARLARAAGFETVHSASGTSADVTRTIKSVFEAGQSPVIHISGKHVRGDICGDLRASGFKAERRIYYQTRPVDVLPDIDMKPLTHVLVYSPLAARTLSGFAPDIGHVTVISISAAADGALGTIAVRARLIASKPTEKAMLSLLD